MQEAFERHRRLILSTLYALTGILVAGYSFMVWPRQAAVAQIQAAHNLMATENKAIEDQLNREKAGRQESGKTADAIRSLPAFLERINDIARKTNVIIHKLTPDPTNKLRFTIQIVEDYFKFVRFSSILESLDVSIHDIQVHPYDLGKTPPLHAITFSLTPRADAEPLSGSRLSELEKKVAAKERRDPFQRYAYVSKGVQIRSEIDLTWIHRLTGIGRLGDKRYATIDSQDYEIGHELNKMKVVAIDADRVRLEKTTDDGLTKYQLKFRRDGKPPPQPTRTR